MKYSKYSVVIVGSGIAGLYAALKLSENINISDGILVITKSKLGESNSRYAQGGIAGVLPENTKDSISLHVSDTIKAGAGLSDFSVAKFISESSSYVIKDLLNYGVDFDKDKDNEDDFALTMEGAHSVKRILHAGGDATGLQIEKALVSKVKSKHNIDIYEETQAVELLIDEDNACKGVITYNTLTDDYEVIYSPAVVLATGGAGQVYSKTTNPSITTGDGIALAYRAGAILQDMEFIQFHPTALFLGNQDSQFLISESVRGEGAKLRNKNGELFALKYDERADLAPRDIVARAIYSEMSLDNTDSVNLDATIIDEETIRRRFPNISKACSDNGIDITKDYIPVSPSAHYTMGGIKSNTNGQTTIRGLYAVGEAGCTSLHGANRLASNSLLECIVISYQLSKFLAAKNLKTSNVIDDQIRQIIKKYDEEDSGFYEGDIDELFKELKGAMWQYAGLVRSQEKLEKAKQIIETLKEKFNIEHRASNLKEYDFRSLLTVAEVIVNSALVRKESRGAHYREDYKHTAKDAAHSYMRKGELISDGALSLA